ncbi:helix-turn-helix domain-containing protein [Flavobacterium sp.]|jgi:AraC-like DNA-binding protein|uniref:helix-turn-helix domain-containing protein n=1 Tax=Flavobacterium sp. TaxID=239 RepID=UPI0037C1425E
MQIIINQYIILNKVFFKKITLYGFLLINIAVFSQNKDSNLENKSFKELRKLFFENEDNKSIQHKIAKLLVTKAKKENNSSNLARAYYTNSLLHTGTKKIVYFDSIINHTNISYSDDSFPMFAFLEKGYELQNMNKIDEAIINYKLAEDEALKRNKINFYYIVQSEIGGLYSENLGEYKKAIPYYLSYYNHFKNKKNVNGDYEKALFSLADVYKSLHNTDSTTYYNKQGYKVSIENKNEYMKSLFVLNEGANHLLKKEYKIALDSINKSYKGIADANDQHNILACYYYKGIANKELGNHKIAVSNFRAVDSLFAVNKNYYPEFVSGYEFLVDYYAKNNRSDSTMYYFNKLKEIDKYFQTNYKELLKSLHTNYDIPKVIKNKEREINKLNDQSKWQLSLLFFSLFFVVLFVILYWKQKKQRKILHYKFERLMQNQAQLLDNTYEVVNNESENTITLSDEVVNDLLVKLESFEKNQTYLEQNITIDYLVNLFDSNSSYVSKVINHFKQKSFSQYINDLRIDFVVEQLKTNKTWRKYTIQALANEIGFSSPDSFTRAFYKKTGIKTSYFLKNLSNYKSDI